MKGTWILAAALTLGSPQAPPTGAAGQNTLASAIATLADFHCRVTTYMDLHHMLEGTVPTLKVSSDPVEIGAAVEALGQAIRRARPNARQGDIFFPAAATMFRRMIRAQYGTRYGELLEMIHEDTPPMRRAVVNGRWPGASHTFMPPDLLRRFPTLPEGLQYRFVDRDLVIWDSHANVIVDVLPDAIPALT